MAVILDLFKVVEETKEKEGKKTAIRKKERVRRRRE